MARFNAVPFIQANSVGGPFLRDRPVGLVLHRTEAGYQRCLRTWTRGPNPKQTSIHFLVGKQRGEVAQLIDTGTIAHHAGRQANAFFLGIEFESIPARPGVRGQDPRTNADELTPFQVSIGGDIIRWISQTHGIPRKGPPSAMEWRQCQGRWSGVLSHHDLGKGGFWSSNHGDNLGFFDLMALGVFPS